MKSKSVILMALSLGFGLVAAIGISQIMKSNTATATPAQPMGPVLLASEFINIRDVLTDKNVRIENWPVNIIPPDAATKLEDIKDMATLSPLNKGTPIIRASLKLKKDIGKIEIPAGFRALPIKVSADGTMNGLLNPGDLVDVIGLFKKKNGREQRTVSRTFLKALRVFSVNSKTSASADRAENATGGSAIVSLLVTEKQAEEIVFVQDTGKIKLVPRGDSNDEDEDVDTIADIMKEIQGDDEPMNSNPGRGQLAGGPNFNSLANVASGQTNSIIVFRGKEASKVIFTADGLPQQIGGPSADSGPRPAPAFPPRGQKPPNFDDDDDFGDGTGNDRRVDEDQYRAQ